jgi:hypothetical protein
LRSNLGAFPTDPNEQNALWYKLYKSVAADPSVVQVHRPFLLTRDYAGIAFMLLVVFGAIGFSEIATCKTASLYVHETYLQSDPHQEGP